MPQNPLGTYPAIQDGVFKPLNLDGDGALVIASAGGALGTATVATDPAAAAADLRVTTQGSLYTAAAKNATLDVGAAVAIKGTPGRLRGILVLDPPSTSGALTVNDCATTGAATSANRVFSVPYNHATMVAGQIWNVDIPCAVGVTVSAVGGGTPKYVLLWD